MLQAPIFLEGLNHQVFRWTCATFIQKHGEVKDVQAHLRHATAATTLRRYMKQIPASVPGAVELFEQWLGDPQSRKAGAARKISEHSGQLFASASTVSQ